MLTYLHTSDGIEITSELFQRYEKSPQYNETSIPSFDDAKDSLFGLNATLFVRATAWKYTFYKDSWPYAMEMENGFFTARISKLVKNTRVQLTFDAFDMDTRRCEYAK